MKQVNEMPTEGQFILTWVYADTPWCGTYRYHEGVLQEFDPTEDCWEIYHDIRLFEFLEGVEYYVLD